MQFTATFKVLGILLMLFSISMFPPIFISWWYHDAVIKHFITGFLLTFFTGLLLWWIFRKQRHELKTRDGFLVVVLFWTVLSTFGCIPFLLGLYPQVHFTDAMFESISGLTTTGATVFTHLSEMPKSILYYRQQLHLLGGMGIIVLAVAILPMLGVGGMQLYRAETVGPIKTTKLKPRMAQSAKALWYIYFGLVLACTLSYWLAGMQLFDAVGESFSTVATGGFSVKDDSFAFYDSGVINVIAIIFMLLGATNFGLHFRFLRERKLATYYKDSELKTYWMILLSVTFIVTVAMLIYYRGRNGGTFLHVLFTVVSMGTTTGMTTADFSLWPTFLPFIIMFTAMLGGCGGSTTGGIKIIRCLLLKEQAVRELKRLVHPQAVYAVKLGGQSLSDTVTQAIWGFIAIFMLLFGIILLVLLGTGLDLTSAFGATMSCLSNSGASIGKVHNNYQHIPSLSKWVLIFAMLAGRLEIFTILVLFTPGYWRK